MRQSACPRLSRASASYTTWQQNKDVDGRDKPGHDKPMDIGFATQVTRADEATIADAARVLRAGGLVAFPTETVYGLGADATNAQRRCAALRGQGPAVVQSADRACPRRDRGARMLGRFDRDAERLGGALARAADSGGCRAHRHARSPTSRPPASIPSRCGFPAIRSRARCWRRCADRSSRHPPTGRATCRRRQPHTCSMISPGASISSSTAALLRSGWNRPSSPASTPSPCCCGLVGCRAPRSSGCSVATLSSNEAAAVETGEAPLAPGMLSSHYAPRTRLRLDATRIDAGEALLAFGPPLPGAARVLNLSADR